MNAITLDLDFPFEGFVNRDLRHARVILRRAKNLDPVKAEVRRSSFGRVHLRLSFPRDLSVFECFLIRAYLLDDAYRIRGDLARFLVNPSDKSVMRCFDEKNDERGTGRAGRWVEYAL